MPKKGDFDTPLHQVSKMPQGQVIYCNVHKEMLEEYIMFSAREIHQYYGV